MRLSFLLTAGLFLGGFWGLLTVFAPTTIASLTSDWTGWLLLGVIGFVLLVPSVFISVSLIFVEQEVSVRDKNVFEGLIGSWQLARGNRLRLVVLVVLPLFSLYVMLIVLDLVFSPLAEDVSEFIVGAVIDIVTFAIMARAYVQVGENRDISPLQDRDASTPQTDGTLE